jgi:hypothetical protein
MAEQVYTERHDVGLVARAIHDHACPSDPDAGCAWFEDGPPCDIDVCAGFARTVLDAMVAAGWRPPSATGAVIHPTHAEQVAYDEGYAQGRTAAAEAIADALDAELKHGAPAMSPAYHSGYRDAARYVRNRGAEAGR